MCAIGTGKGYHCFTTSILVVMLPSISSPGRMLPQAGLFDLNHNDLNHDLNHCKKNHLFLIFLIFINILSIIINILLIFNDKFDFFFKYILCVCLLFCNHVKQL